MIAIIDYNSGNITSIKNAFEKLGVEFELTNNIEKIQKADKVVFPGVGRAGYAMKELQRTGLNKIIPELKQPFLGICLGTQLLADFSEEDNTKCLSAVKGKVKKFPNSVKVPHIGWNKVEFTQGSPLFQNIPNNSYFYFVNSFYIEPSDKENQIAKTSYGIDFTCAVNKNNFYAVQFHPEKSGKIGQQVLKNFLKLQAQNILQKQPKPPCHPERGAKDL